MSTSYKSSAYASTIGVTVPVIPAAVIPNGTFVPGTKVQVGGWRVIIEKYLSEGGFAHVYLVRLPKPVDGESTAVLKRVAVPDRDALASMRTEVETMKKLKGRRHIVTYIDSHASELKGGGYEVFLLMEYCNGGGLIDFMNTRLQNRLTEPEILKIISDVSMGVACMHYLKPPLLHRDLKVENILITKADTSRLYKVCDFGSAAPPRAAATNAAEGRLIEEDVQKHTTLQYRSPEMIDVYRKQAIDEKADIWALGVLLFKLCYYKTPFEEQGQMAILNASFKYPSYPAFSDRLKKLIASMLRENPQQRPNIYQVVRDIADLRGTDIPIKDIYNKNSSQARVHQQDIKTNLNKNVPPLVGAIHAPRIQEVESLPEITPMRRGRPTRNENPKDATKPSPSPRRNFSNDPFRALDTKGPVLSKVEPTDDASLRFPALYDFSLLQDQGGKFSFAPTTMPVKESTPPLSERVTNALADEAFAAQASASDPSKRMAVSNSSSRPISQNVPSSYRSSIQTESKTAKRPTSDQQDTQVSKMVSTGTMTSPPPSPGLKPQGVSHVPIFRIPTISSEQRSLSQPPKFEGPGSMTNSAVADQASQGSLNDHRTKSQTGRPDEPPSYLLPTSKNDQTSFINTGDESLKRSRSSNSKSRPSSTQSSRPSILRRLSREKSSHHEVVSQDNGRLSCTNTGQSDIGDEAIKIDSNVDYLKAMEEGENSRKREKRHSSGSRHIKRSSMPSVSLSGTKQLLAGRFGEAFRKFETNTGPDRRDASQSPVRGSNDLTPIAGSEATDERSDDDHILDESEEVAPEVRRELERRRLSQEERRVTDAAAAYKRNLAAGGSSAPSGPKTKAASIQSKVRSLLDESGRASPSPTKTTSGYGRYTDHLPTVEPSVSKHSVNLPQNLPVRTSSRPAPSQGLSQDPPSAQYPPRIGSKASSRPLKPPAFQPLTLTNTVSAPSSTSDHLSKTTSLPASLAQQQNGSDRASSQTMIDSTQRSNTLNMSTGPPKLQPKPHILRKPVCLEQGVVRPQSPAKPSSLASMKIPSTLTSSHSTTNDTLPAIFRPDDHADSPDDWETNFSKRYPDLSGLEMVETEIDSGVGIGAGAGAGASAGSVGKLQALASSSSSSLSGLGTQPVRYRDV